MAHYRQPSIEQKIARGLAPVSAPDELWNRVSAALPPAAGPSPTAPFGRRGPKHLAVIAALAAALTTGVIYLRAYERPPSLVETALQMHRSGANTPDSRYAVQRYPELPATLVSLPSNPARPNRIKEVRTSEVGDLAISEWASQGRQWALVSHRSAHRAACRMCHKA